MLNETEQKRLQMLAKEDQIITDLMPYLSDIIRIAKDGPDCNPYDASLLKKVLTFVSGFLYARKSYMEDEENENGTKDHKKN